MSSLIIAHFKSLKLRSKKRIKSGNKPPILGLFKVGEV